jgi:hypothetical protein
MPGVVVRTGSNYSISISYSGAGGALYAKGKPDSSIMFTSSKKSRAAGNWGSIRFYKDASSSDCILENCIVEYGGYHASYPASIYSYVATPTFRNIIIRNCTGSAMDLEGAGFDTLENLTVINNTGYVLECDANWVGDIAGPITARGNTNQAILVTETDITVSKIWKNHGIPYIISETIDIGGGSGAGIDPVLTIAPACTLKFMSGISLRVAYYGYKAGLIACGKVDSMIVFTSSRSIPAAGDWGNIQFKDQSIDNSCLLDYCKIMYASDQSGSSGAIYVSDAKPTLKNSIFSNSKGIGLFVSSYEGPDSVVSCSFINGSSFAIQTNAENIGNLFGPLTIADNLKNAIRIASDGDVITSQRWKNHGCPYYVDITVDVGGSQSPVLTLDPKVELKFSSSANFRVGYHYNGGLMAIGYHEGQSMTGAISFTSQQTTPQAGDWGYLGFYSKAITNQCKLSDCLVNYAGSSSSNGAMYISSASPTIINCGINSAKYTGIVCSGGAPDTLDTTGVNGAGEFAIQLEAEYVRNIGPGFVGSSCGKNFIRVINNGNISTTATWSTHYKTNYMIGVTIDVGGSLDPVLTIAPGCSLFFEAGLSIRVGYINGDGGLIANGNSTNRIYFGSGNGAGSPGDWERVYISSSNMDATTSLSYVTINNGGKNYGELYISSASLQVNNCEFKNSATYGIYKSGGTYTGSGNTFTSCASGNEY